MWTKNIWIRVIGPVYFVHFSFQIEVGQPAHFLNLFWLVIMGYVVKSHWLVTFATWFLLKRIGMFWSFTKKDRWKRGWSLMDNYFKHNYCHACHTRFAVFFILLRMFTTHSPHSRPKNPVRFLLSCKADSRLQGPVENIPDGYSGWFKNRTKQNKIKQNKNKQTTKHSQLDPC